MPTVITRTQTDTAHTATLIMWMKRGHDWRPHTPSYVRRATQHSTHSAGLPTQRWGFAVNRSCHCCGAADLSPCLAGWSTTSTPSWSTTTSLAFGSDFHRRRSAPAWPLAAAPLPAGIGMRVYGDNDCTIQHVTRTAGRSDSRANNGEYCYETVSGPETTVANTSTSDDV